MRYGPVAAGAGAPDPPESVSVVPNGSRMRCGPATGMAAAVETTGRPENAFVSDPSPVHVARPDAMAR
jgi:hypothetical protein